ncbi:putative orfan [Tupanvirus soda lake]|uniref:Orfan n=2 Tax=Tupanvirus TaxID=2094720 RepID=A0AC62ADC5_9VIRU|nr:putative orfan [Tupanvirus soda lake]QKU35796.1 putative orfan [Tupanvirus soda lake]
MTNIQIIVEIDGSGNCVQLVVVPVFDGRIKQLGILNESFVICAELILILI